MGTANTETLEWKQLGVLEEQIRMKCEWRGNRRGDRSQAKLIMFFEAMKDPALYFEWDGKPLGDSAQENET